MTAATPDEAIASKLASYFMLHGVSCMSVEGKLIAEAVGEGATLGWDVPKVRALWEFDGSELKAVLPLNLFVTAKTEESADAVRVAEITVALRLEYSLRTEKSIEDEDEIKHYVGVCSTLHAWPYFRADVQWLTTKMGFPPLVLPVILSGHAAKRVVVSRLRDVKADPGV